jgi:hypothetical protein
MDQPVKKLTYYDRHKDDRKKYQEKYRNDHLEEIRLKDRIRKRRTDKGAPKVLYPLIFRENVVVSFD